MSPPPAIAWREIDDADVLVDSIISLFERNGEHHYDEAVTQNQHATQAATLARRAGADDQLVAAALLHDLGHLLLGEHQENDGSPERDLHHENVAARFLSAWFGPSVTEPIRLHVAAKRHLCAVDDGYHATLSDASVASLRVQGGPMTTAEVAAFRRLPSSEDAARLRRWDDLAKDPGAAADPVRSYVGLLVPLVRFGR